MLTALLLIVIMCLVIGGVLVWYENRQLRKANEIVRGVLGEYERIQLVARRHNAHILTISLDGLRAIFAGNYEWRHGEHSLIWIHETPSDEEKLYDVVAKWVEPYPPLKDPRLGENGGSNEHGTEIR